MRDLWIHIFWKNLWRRWQWTQLLLLLSLFLAAETADQSHVFNVHYTRTYWMLDNEHLERVYKLFFFGGGGRKLRKIFQMMAFPSTFPDAILRNVQFNDTRWRRHVCKVSECFLAEFIFYFLAAEIRDSLLKNSQDTGHEAERRVHTERLPTVRLYRKHTFTRCFWLETENIPTGILIKWFYT